MKKRDLFAELMDGIGEMKAQREGNITLPHHKVSAAQPGNKKRPEGRFLRSKPGDQA